MSDEQYPEHIKLEKVMDKSQTCGEFLEWLEDKGFILCEYHNHTDGCYDDEGEKICDIPTTYPFPIHKRIEDLLAEFFKIDQGKLEQEKRQMLNEIRANQTK